MKRPEKSCIAYVVFDGEVTELRVLQRSGRIAAEAQTFLLDTAGLARLAAEASTALLHKLQIAISAGDFVAAIGDPSHVPDWIMRNRKHAVRIPRAKKPPAKKGAKK